MSNRQIEMLKTGGFLCKILLLAWCLAGSQLVQAQQQKSRSVSKAFRVNALAPVQLTGKYAKMDIRTWDKPEVSVEIRLVVKGRSMAEVENMLERVEIDISGDANGVMATANIADSQQWNQSGDGLRIRFRDGASLSLQSIEIHFSVHMPKNNPLKVDNKFGDISLGELAGNADIWLKYGKIQALSLSGSNKLSLGYAKAEIGYFGEGDFEASYSEVEIDKLKSLRIDSRYSETEIGSEGSITAGNKYNDYSIGEVGTLILDEKHGEVDIRRVGKMADVVMSYGAFAVASLGGSFERVKFAGEHVNFSLVVDPGASYTFDAAANHTKISFPQNLRLSEQISTPGYEKIMGRVGANPKSTIYIRTDYGKVRVE